MGNALHRQRLELCKKKKKRQPTAFLVHQERDVTFVSTFSICWNPIMSVSDVKCTINGKHVMIKPIPKNLIKLRFPPHKVLDSCGVSKETFRDYCIWK